MIFVSYRTDDQPFGAAAIHAKLSDRFGPGNVFRDCVSMQPAEHYPTALRRALADADVLVVVIGPDWLDLADSTTGERLLDRENDWVRRELATAFDRGIPVVPVLLKDTPRHAARIGHDTLPADIRTLADLQTSEVSQRHLDRDVNRLADRLDEIAPAPAPHRGRPAAWWRNPWLIPIAVLTVGTAVLVPTVRSHRPGTGPPAGSASPTASRDATTIQVRAGARIDIFGARSGFGLAPAQLTVSGRQSDQASFVLSPYGDTRIASTDAAVTPASCAAELAQRTDGQLQYGDDAGADIPPEGWLCLRSAGRMAAIHIRVKTMSLPGILELTILR